MCGKIYIHEGQWIHWCSHDSDVRDRCRVDTGLVTDRWVGDRSVQGGGNSIKFNRCVRIEKATNENWVRKQTRQAGQVYRGSRWCGRWQVWREQVWREGRWGVLSPQCVSAACNPPPPRHLKPSGGPQWRRGASGETGEPRYLRGGSWHLGDRTIKPGRAKIHKWPAQIGWHLKKLACIQFWILFFFRCRPWTATKLEAVSTADPKR